MYLGPLYSPSIKGEHKVHELPLKVLQIRANIRCKDPLCSPSIKGDYKVHEPSL